MKAKILISSTILVLFFLPSAFGQIGVKAGAGIADIAFKYYGQTNYLGYEVNTLIHNYPRFSAQAGVFSTFKVAQRIDFQPEVLYSLQGLDYSTKFIYDDISYRLNIHYLKFPLLFKYKTALKKNRDSGIILGPYASWKLKATKKTEVEGQKESTKMPNVKDLDFGLVVGFSFDYNLPKGQLVIDLRSSYSLINMMDRIEGFIPDYTEGSKDYARNVTLSLTVGYRFLNIWSKKANEQ